MDPRLRPADAVVFTAPGGGPLADGNFRNRVFTPALRRAGVRPGTPHDMRHTAASHLVQAGVPLYEVQMLLGHESFATTTRYAHLQPDAHERITLAWTSMRAPADLGPVRQDSSPDTV